eukprot:scaffold5238_cov177-Amphora_coffeaeformis.AAC.4
MSHRFGSKQTMRISTRYYYYYYYYYYYTSNCSEMLRWGMARKSRTTRALARCLRSAAPTLKNTTATTTKKIIIEKINQPQEHTYIPLLLSSLSLVHWRGYKQREHCLDVRFVGTINYTMR